MSARFASVEDWASDLAGQLAEAYCLPFNVSQALADEMAEVIKDADLKLRPDGSLTPMRVLDQTMTGASTERMAFAEGVGRGLDDAGFASAVCLVRPEVWAGFCCAALAISYDVTPMKLVVLVGGLARVFERYGFRERPLRVLSKPLLKQLAFSPKDLKRPEEPPARQPRRR